MAFATRFKQAREHAGLKKADVARELGVSRTAISNWDSGKSDSMRSGLLSQFATLTGVSIVWLINGTGNMLDNPETVVCIKTVNTAASFSIPSSVLTKLGVSVSEIESFEVEDDSLAPELPRHSVLLINKQLTSVNDGAFYAFRINGRVTVRKVFRTSNGFMLRPTNSLFPDEEIKTVDPLGKVVYSSSMH